MKFFSEEYLAHYGVKGMKWNKHIMAGKNVKDDSGQLSSGKLGAYQPITGTSLSGTSPGTISVSTSKTTGNAGSNQYSYQPITGTSLSSKTSSNASKSGSVSKAKSRMNSARNRRIESASFEVSAQKARSVSKKSDEKKKADM